jgi:hypothetical protein
MQSKLSWALFFAPIVACLSMGPAQNAHSQESQPNEPRYTKDGELIHPGNYREWIYLSSGLGMTYRASATASNSSPNFDNVFVTPQAYRAFLASGVWPDKTIFALEVRAAGSKASINKGGHFQEELVSLEVEVKDKTLPGGWAFFGFGAETQPAKRLPVVAGCQACHTANGAVEQTFVQFYPTLIPVAKTKGTFRATPEN